MTTSRLDRAAAAIDSTTAKPANRLPRNAKSSKRKPGRRMRTPEERFPELKTLPFVTYLGGPPGTNQVDWWDPPAVENANIFDDGFRGAMYALQTIRHMTKHPDAYPVLCRIINAMVAKGRYGFGRDKDKPDHVAPGFIGAIIGILINADLSGIVNRWATMSAKSLQQTADARHRDKVLTASIERTIAERRAFATGVQEAETPSEAPMHR